MNNNVHEIILYNEKRRPQVNIGPGMCVRCKRLPKQQEAKQMINSVNNCNIHIEVYTLLFLPIKR